MRISSRYKRFFIFFGQRCKENIVCLLVGVIMRLDFQIIIVLYQPFVCRMRYWQLIKRRSQTSTYLYHIGRQFKKFIKCHSVCIIKMVFLTRDRYRFEQFFHTVIIFGYKHGVIVISYLFIKIFG